MASSTERFANLGEAEIQKLLEDKDTQNTKISKTIFHQMRSKFSDQAFVKKCFAAILVLIFL